MRRGVETARATTQGRNPRRVVHAAFIHGSNDLYGASRILVDDVRILTAMGFRVTVVLPDDGPLTGLMSSAGAFVVFDKLHVLRRVDMAGLRIPMRLPSALASCDIAVISTLALINYAPALRIRRKRVISSILEIQQGTAGSILARLAATITPTMISCSEATRQWLLQHGTLWSDPIVAYPIAPPYDPLPPLSSDVPFRVLLAGRVNGFKGHLEAIYACRQVRDHHGIDVTLDLLGGPFPGQEHHLTQLLAEAASYDWVTYHGEVRDIRPFLGRTHVLLVPTMKPEPFGIVALEAWAAGRRIVASDEGGLAEVTRMVEGVTFPPRDVPGIASALARVASDPDLLAPPGAQVEAARRCSITERTDSWRRALLRVGASSPGGSNLFDSAASAQP